MILSSESSTKHGSDGLNLQSEELKVAMRFEIGSQAWEAPPEDFIRMLSPKKVKVGILDTSSIHWSLADFMYETDGDEFSALCDEARRLFLDAYCGPGTTEWPETGKESDYYKPLEDFLNYTILTCGAACSKKDSKYRNDRLFKGLHFSCYNRHVMDSIEPLEL